MNLVNQIKPHLHADRPLTIFLDYDGTLDDFVPTPDKIIPNPEVINILTQLVNNPNTHPIILSGRMLGHLQQLLPVPRLTLAGTYGFEIQNGSGKINYQEEPEKIKQSIKKLKEIWQEIIPSNQGFFLEDKIWALAIHGKFVNLDIIQKVFLEAKQSALSILDPKIFHLVSDIDFFEAIPHKANKSNSVHFLINHYIKQKTDLLYIGDDTKDEEAMIVIKQIGGFAIKVTKQSHHTIADWILPSPQEVRGFLKTLLIPTKKKEADPKAKVSSFD